MAYWMSIAVFVFVVKRSYCGDQHYKPPTKFVGGEEIKQIVVCEDDKKKIECPVNTSITVESALYGQPGSNPGICTNNYQSTCNKTENVIDDVFQRCEWKSSCLITPKKFEKNPCTNVTRHVVVKYRCINGTETGKQAIDLSGKGFEHVPKILSYVPTKRIFADCKSLDLRNNKISVIKKGAFKNLIHLKILSLSGNPLQVIRGDMWEGLQSLKVLRITNINLTALQSKGFAHLKSLKTLTLNLAVLKKFTFLNTSTYFNTPEGQIKFRIELGGREITCDTGFCFLNNMQKKGLIEGFKEQGEEINEPICKTDQNPFWKYSSLNCENGQEGKSLPTEAVYCIIVITGLVVLLILLVAIWYKRSRTESYSFKTKDKARKDEINMKELEPYEEENLKEHDSNRCNK